MGGRFFVCCLPRGCGALLALSVWEKSGPISAQRPGLGEWAPCALRIVPAWENARPVPRASSLPGRAHPVRDEKTARFCTTSRLGRVCRFPGDARSIKTPGNGRPSRPRFSQAENLCTRISPKPRRCVKIGAIRCSRGRRSPKAGRCAEEKADEPARRMSSSRKAGRCAGRRAVKPVQWALSLPSWDIE